MSRIHNQHKETLRNVTAFVKSYLNGSHGQNTLNRPVRFTEITDNNSKGKPVTHKQATGYASLAYAFAEAVR